MYSDDTGIDFGSTLCPLCKSNCYWNEGLPPGRVLCACPTCGKFVLGTNIEFFLMGLSDADIQKIYKISFALRTVSEKALGKRDNSYFPPYSSNDLRKMLEEPEPSVQEKLTLLIKHMGRITEYPGQENEFDSANDYSIVCAKNYQEANFYLDSLVEQGLATREQSFTGSRLPRFKVTANGWKELDRINQSGAESSNAFIAMWFDKDRDPFEQAISAAVRDAGYLPVRVDKIEHVNHVDDEIIAQIRNSKFLISDFTGQRHGVYFEAGFMLGLGRPVIWVCDREDLENVHFDTRQYNTIDYTDADDLRKRLQFRIEAILGKGPQAEQ